MGNRLYIDFGTASRFGPLLEALRSSRTEWKSLEPAAPPRSLARTAIKKPFVPGAPEASLFAGMLYVSHV
jgi:hypothetical protein